MKGASVEGYTVVEVSLFLAVSGLLFLIALFGTGNTIRSVRFTDSGRSLTAFMQKQYDSLIAGVNTRPNTVSCAGGVIGPGSQTPGTSNCLLMGKLILFNPGDYKVNVYSIVGTEPASVDYNQTDEDLIVDFAPQVVPSVGTEEYDIPWEAYISDIRRTSDNQATNGLVLIRSPRSTRVINYTYKPVLPLDNNLNSVVNTATNANRTTNFCIKNADGLGAPAKIVVNDAPNQTAVSIKFDTTDGDCDGV